MKPNNRRVRQAAAVGSLIAVVVFFPLRNLLAALLMFSIVFGVFAVFFGALYMADELAQGGTEQARAWFAHACTGHRAAATGAQLAEMKK